MKKLDYVYFTIYHYCSRQSYFPDSLLVRMSCMYLLALSVGGWLLFLQTLFLRFVQNAWFSSHSGAMVSALTIYFGIAVLFYRIFIIDKKDQKIVDKYARAWQENPNKKRDSFLALIIASAPYIAMACIKFFISR